MSHPATHFLITYDRSAAESRVEDLGPDAAAALRVYEQREREFAGSDEVEVVLVGSESLETLRQTHSSYFGAAARVEEALAGAA